MGIIDHFSCCFWYLRKFSDRKLTVEEIEIRLVFGGRIIDQTALLNILILFYFFSLFLGHFISIIEHYLEYITLFILN